MLVASLLPLAQPVGYTRLSYPTRGFISHLLRTSALCVLFRNDPHVDLDRALGILSKNTSRQREVNHHQVNLGGISIQPRP